MNKIFVQVKAASKQRKVERIDETHFRVWVSVPPIEGRANEAVIKAIGEYLEVAPSRISIKSGHTSKQKCLEIV